MVSWFGTEKKSLSLLVLFSTMVSSAAFPAVFIGGSTGGVFQQCQQPPRGYREDQGHRPGHPGVEWSWDTWRLIIEISKQSKTWAPAKLSPVFSWGAFLWVESGEDRNSCRWRIGNQCLIAWFPSIHQELRGQGLHYEHRAIVRGSGASECHHVPFWRVWLHQIQDAHPRGLAAWPAIHRVWR